jgi:hypothetical protein
MLYRPKFCCECGEKIERIEWRIWTNRRFCEVCDADHKLSGIISGVGIVFVGIVSVFGFGNYLWNRPGGNLPVISRSNVADRSASNNIRATGDNSFQSQPVQRPSTLADVHGDTAPGISDVKVVKSEPVYFCGAATKKGTACTRRVKGNVRCWQHVGMPAILPAAKLLVSR